MSTPEPPVHHVTVSAQFTYHTSIPPAPGSKAKPKDKKEYKTKELTYSFSPTLENYVAFLNALLTKHGEEKYGVKDRKRYPFKVLCPPAKSVVISSTSDRLGTDSFTGKVMLLMSTTLRSIRNSQPTSMGNYSRR